MTIDKSTVTKNWGQWPADWGLAEVTDVAVDSDDNVYAFVRGPHPIVVFSPEGIIQDVWGEGDFANPHAISIAADGSVYCTDNLHNAVRHYDPSGNPLNTIVSQADPGFYEGVDDGLAWTITRPGPPFNCPTAAVAAEDGTVYVTDGYGNCCVHAFAPDGHLQFSWGEPGSRPGQFTIPHGVTIGPDDLLYVADRVNSRVQIFDLAGRYVREWPARLPNSLCFDSEGYAYVAEIGATVILSDQPALRWPPARITIRDQSGTIVDELHEDDPAGDGMYWAPHGVAIDSQRRLYVAEVPYSYSGSVNLPIGTSVFRRYDL